MKKMFLCFLLAITFGMSSANTFFEKPVKVIVPLGPGGGVDIIARILSKNLAEIWKIPVIVENLFQLIRYFFSDVRIDLFYIRITL